MSGSGLYNPEGRQPKVRFTVPADKRNFSPYVFIDGRAGQAEQTRGL